MIARANYRKRFRPVLAYDLKDSKGPEIVFSNLTSGELEGMVAEFETVARRSHKCQIPVAHFCFSLAPGEELTTEQWSEFFEAVLNEFGALQGVGIKHADTPHVNTHLVMNRVRADGKTWSTSNDRLRLRSICHAFEKKFGLRVLPSRSDVPRVSKTELEKANRLHVQQKAATPIPPRMVLAERVRAALEQSRTPQEFTERLSQQGIDVRWRLENGRIAGTSYACGDIAVSGRNAGISVRSVRERFSAYGIDEKSTPSRPAPGMDGCTQGAIARRDYFSNARSSPAASGDCAPERHPQRIGRRPPHDRRVAEDSVGESLMSVLGEAVRYGAVGLLGLLEIVLANTVPYSRARKYQSRRKEIPFP